jgi:hypothetical protein
MAHFKLDGPIENREGEGAFSQSQLKRVLKKALLEGDLAVIERLSNQVPIRKLVNPVFSFFCDVHELVRWRAVTLMGILVSRLADQDMESARVIMRRLMWSLNDESGGIGWGSPEAMGEIMARHEKLAVEYAAILSSYARKDRNFLEHEMLQRGVIWGIGRLAQQRPHCLTGVDAHLAEFLDSKDAVHRGFSAWALGNLKSRLAVPKLKTLLKDGAEISFYDDFKIELITVGHLAKLALTKII